MAMRTNDFSTVQMWEWKCAGDGERETPGLTCNLMIGTQSHKPGNMFSCGSGVTCSNITYTVLFIM